MLENSAERLVILCEQSDVEEIFNEQLGGISRWSQDTRDVCKIEVGNAEADSNLEALQEGKTLEYLCRLSSEYLASGGYVWRRVLGKYNIPKGYSGSEVEVPRER